MSNNPSHAWLFDVDGVITHPDKKQRADTQILEEITKMLTKGQPVALITGRSLEWLVEKIILPLKSQISNHSILDNLFITGEFGGSYIEFENGVDKHFTDPDIKVPDDVVEEARAITQKYPDTMMWDGSKLTMVSVEMKDGIDFSLFKQAQPSLDEELEDLLRRKGINDTFQVHSDLVATNIIKANTDKALAVNRFLDWLRQRKMSPSTYTAFGDGFGDLRMADEVHSHNLPVRFVFVGDPEKIEGQKREYSIVFTNNKFSEGTLEYLVSSDNRQRSSNKKRTIFQ